MPARGGTNVVKNLFFVSLFLIYFNGAGQAKCSANDCRQLILEVRDGDRDIYLQFARLKGQLRPGLLKRVFTRSSSPKSLKARAGRIADTYLGIRLSLEDRNVKMKRLAACGINPSPFPAPPDFASYMLAASLFAEPLARIEFVSSP